MSRVNRVLCFISQVFKFGPLMSQRRNKLTSLPVKLRDLMFSSMLLGNAYFLISLSLQKVFYDFYLITFDNETKLLIMNQNMFLRKYS